MIFLFPIGLYFYFFVERKNRATYQKTFDDFGDKISKNTTLTDNQKLNKYINMLTNNDYKITTNNSKMIIGEKKIISMSLITMGIGTYFVGLIIYIIYFKFFQKPHIVEFSV